MQLNSQTRLKRKSCSSQLLKDKSSPFIYNFSQLTQRPQSFTLCVSSVKAAQALNVHGSDKPLT